MATLVNYTTAHALWHHSKQGIPSRVPTKNKNVFRAVMTVIFNTIAKVGVIPGVIVTLTLLQKNKNHVSGWPGVWVHMICHHYAHIPAILWPILYRIYHLRVNCYWGAEGACMCFSLKEQNIPKYVQITYILTLKK